jgi:hypothetical protein
MSRRAQLFTASGRTLIGRCVHLPGVDHQSNVPVDLAAQDEAVWVRVRDIVVEFRLGG